MYLLFTENYTETNRPEIGDGSKLVLIQCQEGWFASIDHKSLIDSLGWSYSEVENVTPLMTIVENDPNELP